MVEPTSVWFSVPGAEEKLGQIVCDYTDEQFWLLLVQVDDSRLCFASQRQEENNGEVTWVSDVSQNTLVTYGSGCLQVATQGERQVGVSMWPMSEVTATDFVEHVHEFFPPTETVQTRDDTAEDEWVDIDALTPTGSGTEASPESATETEPVSNTCDFRCQGEMRTGTVRYWYENPQ
jgi:hypothetical protein